MQLFWQILSLGFWTVNENEKIPSTYLCLMLTLGAEAQDPHFPSSSRRRLH